ncbi:MAG: glycosyltransferase family 39 protein [Patescibacteria group bacterium]
MVQIKKHKLIAIILLLGFIATVSYAFYFHVKPSVDAKAYDSIAWSIVQGTGYTETTSLLPDSAIGRLGPGYEFFLAAIYWVFGHQLWIVWIIQSILHTASAFIVYCLIRRLYFNDNAEKYAAIGAGFYIFFIDLLEFPAMLLTETLYLFLVLSGIYFALLMWEKPALRNVLTTSALFTLALLVRPPVTILMLVAFGFLMSRRLWRYAAIFAVTAVIILTPWTVRNYLKYQRFIVTSAILGYDVWVGNSPDSKYIGELTATEEIDRYTAEEGLFAANKRGIREVLNLALKHPLEFIKLQLVKTSIYFSAARPAAFWFHLSGISRLLTIIFSSIFAFVIFTFGFSGLWMYIKKRDLISRMMVLTTLAAPAGIIWIVAETRYRYQIYPMMIILGVLFLAELLKDWRKYKTTIITAALIISVNTAFDVIFNIPRVLERFHRLFL